MFTWALRGVISGPPFLLSPRTTQTDCMPPAILPLAEVGLLRLSLLCRSMAPCCESTCLRAASGEGPQPRREPWGCYLLGTLNGKVLGLTPPLHPWHFLCVLPPPACSQWRWGGGRAPVQECSAAAARPTPPPPSRGLAGIAAMSSLAYQQQQNNHALTVLVNTGLG